MIVFVYCYQLHCFQEMAGQAKEINWKTVDLYNKPLPETIKNSKSNVAVATKTIIVEVSMRNEI